ncbi:MAG: addiction module toxin, HicA family [Candidatus Cloacimonetes bacterium]|nr:addiction module toxin, HicA family [Candidatus Cloacimonadota bacterium]MBL7086901.1 addiction module toxin, HicA family [Candidatus Cloacimonadota bacterium]
MKRNELVQWLKKNGAQLIREGRRHSIFGKEIYRTEIPRHREIQDILAIKICKDLRIPFMKK